MLGLTYRAEGLDLLRAVDVDLKRIVDAEAVALSLHVGIIEQLLLKRQVLGTDIAILVRPFVHHCVGQPLDVFRVCVFSSGIRVAGAAILERNRLLPARFGRTLEILGLLLSFHSGSGRSIGVQDTINLHLVSRFSTLNVLSSGSIGGANQRPCGGILAVGDNLRRCRTCRRLVLEAL